MMHTETTRCEPDNKDTVKASGIQLHGHIGAENYRRGLSGQSKGFMAGVHLVDRAATDGTARRAKTFPCLETLGSSSETIELLHEAPKRS